jgi:hypothetical protein
MVVDVAGDGIEPSTSRFSVARSYQLSYPAEVVSTISDPDGT